MYKYTVAVEYHNRNGLIMYHNISGEQVKNMIDIATVEFYGEKNILRYILDMKDLRAFNYRSTYSIGTIDVDDSMADFMVNTSIIRNVFSKHTFTNFSEHTYKIMIKYGVPMAKNCTSKILYEMTYNIFVMDKNDFEFYSAACEFFIYRLDELYMVNPSIYRKIVSFIFSVGRHRPIIAEENLPKIKITRRNVMFYRHFYPSSMWKHLAQQNVDNFVSWCVKYGHRSTDRTIKILSMLSHDLLLTIAQKAYL